jgi:hypothetical protein
MQEGERKNKSLLVWIKDNCEQMSQEPWQPSHFNQTEDSKGKVVLLYDCDAGALYPTT